LLLFLWFLLSFWLFARNVWGPAVANISVAVVAILPITLRYCFFTQGECIGLGATFSALVMFTSPQPRDRGWTAKTALFGAFSALLSWYNWVILLPCLWLEWRRGNRRGAGTAGAVVTLIPGLLPAAIILSAGASGQGALEHLRARLSTGEMAPGVHPFSHLDLFHRFLIWCFGNPCFFGPLASGLTAAVLLWALLARLSRRQSSVPGDTWLLALALYGMPFTLLLPNMATYHDFFMELYAPVVAICCALAITALGQCPWWRGRSGAATAIAAVALLVAIATTASWPSRRDFLPVPLDYHKRDVSVVLGNLVTPESAVFGSVRVIGYLTDEDLQLASRDPVWMNPWAMCLTGKTAYVCRNSTELAVLLSQLAPGRPVVVVEQDGDLEPLPTGVVRHEIGPFTVATCQTPTHPR
jgi:hypothetical protein